MSERVGALDDDLTRLWASVPAVMSDPTPSWRQLHEEAPVHRFGASILFSRHADVRDIHLRGLDWATMGVPRNSAEADAVAAALPPEEQAALTELLAFEDLFVSRTSSGERHDRLRAIAHPIFTPRRIAWMEALARSFTDELLTPVAEVDGVCDLAVFCHHLPLMVIASLLGVPREEWELLVADPSLAPQAVEELLRYVSPAQLARTTRSRTSSSGASRCERATRSCR